MVEVHPDEQAAELVTLDSLLAYEALHVIPLLKGGGRGLVQLKCSSFTISRTNGWTILMVTSTEVKIKN